MQAIIALSIPGFILCILIEIAVHFARERRVARTEAAGPRADGGPYYRFADTVTSLASGIGQQAFAALVTTAMAAWIYAWAYDHAVFNLGERPFVMAALAFFGVDFLYWVYHLASHRINVLWASHVAHHSSEEYNLSTALRQSWLTSFTSWIFYVPLSFLGVSPEAILASFAINLLYQFWIHTRAIDRLGPLEWILNTPSHHRVHHGIDPAYLDANYGGIFIVWDRLFGTFVKESAAPNYGTVKPLRSFDPAWVNLEGFVALARVSRKTARWQDKLAIWVRPPEWLPADLGGPVSPRPVPRARELYQVDVKRPIYVALQLASSIGLLGVLFGLGEDATLWKKLALTVAIVLTLVGLARVMERDQVKLDLLRLPLALGLAVAALEGTFVAIAISLGWLTLSLSVLRLEPRMRGPRGRPAIARPSEG